MRDTGEVPVHLHRLAGLLPAQTQADLGTVLRALLANTLPIDEAAATCLPALRARREKADFINSHNEFVEKQGLPLAKHRML